MDGGGGAGYGAGGGGGSGFVWTQETSKNAPSKYSVPTKYYLNNASTSTGQRTGDGYARITLINGEREVTETVTEETTSAKWKTIQGIIEEGILTGNFLWNGHTITVTDTNGETVVYGGKSDNIPTERPIPIPEGYVASEVEGENTKEDGLVIYEGTDPVTAENHATAMSSRNQYVWIPVDDINDMVMCSSNSESSQCKLELDGEILKCTTHSATATDLVGRLYTGTRVDCGNKIFSYILDFEERGQTYNSSSGTREPAVLLGSDYSWGGAQDTSSTNLTTAGMPSGSTAEQFLTQLKSDFTAMATSVAKNGGFYVGRYEIGINGDSKKNQLAITAGSSDGPATDPYFKGVDGWYGLYKNARKIDKNIQMIWGCQYDQVIKFLRDGGETPEYGHSHVLTTRTPTGQNESDKMKNIYDLEGNNNEWTMESSERTQRGLRGNAFYGAYLGTYSAASARSFMAPSAEGNYFSSRTTLYI